MLKWPEQAKRAIRKLFEPLQEIDVFVEDTNDEGFYRCLLNKATNGTVKIARVFALGGRKAVVDAAALHDQRIRPSFFIIDGDLPWVKGEPTPNILGLHQHDAYCVENLLLCEKAIATVLSQEIADTEEEATRRLAYQQWRQSILPPLLELFSAFATAHDYVPEVPTVSLGVGVMCVQPQGSRVTELDPEKVRGVRDCILRAAEASADGVTVSARYMSLLDRLMSMSDPSRAVSGKSFLLPLLDFHLQSLGCRIKRKSLRVRLASAGD
ncbi:MAG: DUF4435 domain-containing protein, partial [Nitrospira sp.]|nr:DUF4435 domain-containing protein [Nitrospira sp.]